MGWAGARLRSEKKGAMDSWVQLLLEGVVWYGVFLVSAVLHEAAHAFAALRLGDPTAYYGGQVSLDPLPHIRREPMGMIGVPLLTFFLNDGQWMMGWASAPYNRLWALDFPKRAAVMALAGPLANLILVLLSGAALKIGLASGVFGYPDPEEFGLTGLVGVAAGNGLDAVAFGLSLVFSLNLILLVFNLLPLPPLDGSSILMLFMPARLARDYLRAIQQPGAALLGLMAAWFGFRYLFAPVFEFVIVRVFYPQLLF